MWPPPKNIDKHQNIQKLNNIPGFQNETTFEPKQSSHAWNKNSAVSEEMKRNPNMQEMKHKMEDLSSWETQAKVKLHKLRKQGKHQKLDDWGTENSLAGLVLTFLDPA